MVSESTQTVSTSTSEATVGSKRKREPEPVLEPAPEPSPEPAEQGFDWKDLPLEVMHVIFEKVCTHDYYHVWWRTIGVRECANDTALGKRCVSREFNTCIWEHHASVYARLRRRTAQRKDYCFHKHFLKDGSFRLKKDGLDGLWALRF